MGENEHVSLKHKTPFHLYIIMYALLNQNIGVNKIA